MNRIWKTTCCSSDEHEAAGPDRGRSIPRAAGALFDCDEQSVEKTGGEEVLLDPAGWQHRQVQITPAFPGCRYFAGPGPRAPFPVLAGRYATSASQISPVSKIRPAACWEGNGYSGIADAFSRQVTHGWIGEKTARPDYALLLL